MRVLAIALFASICVLATLSAAADPGGCEKALVDIAGSARMYLDICAHTFALPSLTKELLAAKERGVDVRLMLDRGNATVSWTQAIKLVPARIPVHGTPHGETIKESFLLADRRIAAVGTAEWKPAQTGDRPGDLRIIRDDPAAIASLIAAFDRMWGDRRYTDLMAPARPAPPEKPLMVSADELFDAYEENAVAADEKYREKTITVTGYVDHVEMDRGTAILIFEVTEWRDRLRGWVRCRFPNENMGKLAPLKEGDKVAVTGVCRGKPLPYSVVLVSCDLPKITP